MFQENDPYISHDDGGDKPPPPPPPPPLPGTDGRPVRASFQMLLKVQALLMTMTDEEKMALGHSETDLIADCEFAGATCSSTYVSIFKQKNIELENCIGPREANPTPYFNFRSI